MRILIIGLGAIGQRHARNLRHLLGDKVELLAFRQRSDGKALTEKLEVVPGKTPEEMLNIRAFRDLDSALAMLPHAVIIANPSSLHLETARRVAESDCAVFMEKPVSHAWAGLPEFMETVSRKRLVTLVGYQWRFHPLLVRVKALLENGYCGALIAVNSTYGEFMPGWHPYEDYRQSYAACRELGGGVLLTQIHDFDYLGWLVGWPEQAFSIGGHLSHLEIDVEDTASTLLSCRFAGRIIPVHVHQDYLQKPPVRWCSLVGEKGKIEFDLLGGKLRAYNAEGCPVVDEDYSGMDRNDMFLSEMKHFLACIEGREQSRIPIVEGARSLAVALAALQSQRSGCVERVMYI